MITSLDSLSSLLCHSSSLHLKLSFGVIDAPIPTLCSRSGCQEHSPSHLQTLTRLESQALRHAEVPTSWVASPLQAHHRLETQAAGVALHPLLQYQDDAWCVGFLIQSAAPSGNRGLKMASCFHVLLMTHSLNAICDHHVGCPSRLRKATNTRIFLQSILSQAALGI